MKRFSFRKILMGIVGLGVVALIVWAFLPKPVDVEAAEVVRGDMFATVDEDGKTRIRKWKKGDERVNGEYRTRLFRYVFVAPVDGELNQILLDPGDKLSKGSVAIRINARPPALLDQRTVTELKNTVLRAKAVKERAKTQVDRAKEAADHAITAYERMRRLPSVAVSRDEFDEARNKKQLAEKDLRIANRSLEIADLEVQVASAKLTHAQSAGGEGTHQITLKIPFDSVVLNVFKEYSETVSAGTKLLEIGDTKELEIVVDVLSEDAVKIADGAKVFIEQWGGDAPLFGYVDRIEPGGFLKVSALGVEEQRVNVIVRFDENANATLKPEELAKRNRLGDAYRVQARIVIWQGDDVIKVPTGALFRAEKQWSAYVITNGRVEKRDVQIGHGNGLETEVLNGLNPGDRVVVHPSDQVKDGVQVKERGE